MSNTAKNTKYAVVFSADEATRVEVSSKKAAIAKGEKSGLSFEVFSPTGTLVHTYGEDLEPVASDEDLLGDVTVEEDDEDLLGEVEGDVEEIDATEVVEGMMVVSARRGHPDVEVARVRIGRKHVTLFNADDVHFVWVPVAGGKVKVRTTE